MNEYFDFSSDYQLHFEAKQEYHVIITGSKIAETDSGKQYIQHTLLGSNGEEFHKKFYVTTDGGRKFYTNFLSSCGVSREETAKWNPINLDGKFVTVEFEKKEYIPEVWNNETNQMEKGETQISFDLKYFRICKATTEIKEALKRQADGSDPF